MATIHFKTLNDNLQESIRLAKVPEKNVIEVSKQLKTENKKNFKILSIVMAAVALLFGGNLAYLFISKSEFREAALQWILGFVAIIAIIYFGAYLCVCGIIKFQFNGALKEGYPELYKKHKI